jgi:hypothetical protein
MKHLTISLKVCAFAILLSFGICNNSVSATSKLDAARNKCVERFKSGELKTNLQRALCINKAEVRYQRPTIHPADKDLLDEHHAFRIWLAKQEDGHVLSAAQAEVEWRKHNKNLNNKQRKRQKLR